MVAAMKESRDAACTHIRQPTRITILVDNEVLPNLNLMPEHGFAALVERGPDRILFDTGQNKALAHNAQVLGKDLSLLSAIVLSHGHYDHAGGLPHALELNPRIRVVAHPALFAHHLKLSDAEDSPRRVGIPYSRKTLEELGAVFDFIPESKELTPGVWFTGTVPRVYPFSGDGKLVTLQGDSLIPDPLDDDCSLLIDTASGPVLLLGCAHAGVVNVLEHVRNRLAKDRIFGVIGGTHLGMASEGEIRSAIKAFERASVEVLAPVHCTGSGPKDALKSHFRSRLHTAAAGSVFEF